MYQLVFLYSEIKLVLPRRLKERFFPFFISPQQSVGSLILTVESIEGRLRHLPGMSLPICTNVKNISSLYLILKKIVNELNFGREVYFQNNPPSLKFIKKGYVLWSAHHQKKVLVVTQLLFVSADGWFRYLFSSTPSPGIFNKWSI